MRKLVGKREKPDPETKLVVALVDSFVSPAGPKPTVIEFNETCASCRAPVKITLSEDVNTGEIWFAGPDTCSGCGHRLSDEGVQVPPLSQKAIQRLFGKY